YYVGASDDKVAIYQGLPQTVLGVPLSRVYEVQQIPLTDLPRFRRQQVRATISANSLDDARTTVDRLDRMAEQCREQRADDEKPPDEPPKSPPPPKESASPSASPSTEPSDEPPPDPDKDCT